MEEIEKLIKGYQFGDKIINKALTSFDWKSFGIFTFGTDVLYESDKVYLGEDQILLPLAENLRAHGKNVILILNGLKPIEPCLSRSTGFNAFIETLSEELRSAVFTFGLPEEESPLRNLKSLKIDLSWLSNQPESFVRIIQDISPKEKDIEVEKIKKQEVFSDLEEVSKFLIDLLGPPSFFEELGARVKKKKGKVGEVTSLATSIGGFVIASSPTLLILKGLNYMSGVFSLLKERRNEEKKAFLEKWKNEVNLNYNAETLSNFIGFNGLEGIKDSLKKYSSAIIIDLTRNTLHQFLLPILLINIHNMVKEKEINVDALIVSNVSTLSNFDLTVDWLQSVLDAENSFSISATLDTKEGFESENLRKMVEFFLREKAVIIDIASEFLDILSKGEPLSQLAWIFEKFERMGELKTQNVFSFLNYDITRPVRWSLDEVSVSVVDRFRKFFHKIR
ncbi:MAG: hypothetical protein ACTSSJ_06135 [Candidatus Odinarchaeia archaeon]